MWRSEITHHTVREALDSIPGNEGGGVEGVIAEESSRYIHVRLGSHLQAGDSGKCVIREDGHRDSGDERDGPRAEPEMDVWVVLASRLFFLLLSPGTESVPLAGGTWGWDSGQGRLAGPRSGSRSTIGRGRDSLELHAG